MFKLNTGDILWDRDKYTIEEDHRYEGFRRYEK